MSSIAIRKHGEFPIVDLVFSVFGSLLPLLAAGLVLILAVVLGIL